MAFFKKRKKPQNKQLDEELARYLIERTREFCKRDSDEFYYKELLDTFAPFIFNNYNEFEARIIMSRLIHKDRRKIKNKSE